MTLSGPVYNVEHQHLFVDIEKKLADLKCLHHPIYDIERQHAFVDIEKKVLELKTLQGPVYSIDRQHNFQEIEKQLADLRNLNYPVRQGDFSHHFNELERKIEGLKTLTGPVFSLEERTHTFQDIERKVEEIRNLTYPVYDINHQHAFSEVFKSLVDLKSMNGPVYDIDHNHSYAEFRKSLDSLKKLVGPVYTIPDYKHHFEGIQAHVADLKTLAGPVYSVEATHAFNEIQKSLADLSTLTGPIYHIESNHNFQGVIKNVEYLNKLYGPHYEIPDRNHHFKEIWKHVDDLKQMVGPVYDTNYKHEYEGPKPMDVDLSYEVGPIYKSERRHSFKHGFNKEMDKKTIKGPVYEVESKHKFKTGFSCKERPPSPTPGPVRGDFKHNYKHPITLPHQRDMRAKSVPCYEVDKSHHYKTSETHKDDLKKLHGPIYSSGKLVDERKHNFNQGYTAPLTREKREEQVKLVNKYFMKEKKATDDLRQKVIDKVENLAELQQVQYQKSVTREEALQRGEERRKEALQRREVQLRNQAETQSMSHIITTQQTSNFKTSSTNKELLHGKIHELSKQSDDANSIMFESQKKANINTVKHEESKKTIEIERNAMEISEQNSVQKQINEAQMITSASAADEWSKDTFATFQNQLHTKQIYKPFKRLNDAPKEQIVHAKEFSPRPRVAVTPEIEFIQPYSKTMSASESSESSSVKSVLASKHTSEQSSLASYSLRKDSAIHKNEGNEKLNFETVKLAAKKAAEDKLAREKAEQERRISLKQEQSRLQEMERDIQRKKEVIYKEAEKSQPIDIKRSESLKGKSQDMTGSQSPGFGSVRTGYVRNKKHTFLSRGSSVEPDGSDTPSRRRRNVWFAQSQENSVRTRVPSPLPDNIKTGDVAAGVADWTHRVAELDRQAAAQTPPPNRRTVLKFGRAGSESRSTSQGVRSSTTTMQTSQRFVGQNREGEVSWRQVESQQTPGPGIMSPPMSICSEKSA